MWPRPRFLVSQWPFNSNTLIYKRLTVVIFDRMGFDGVVCNLGNLWRFWVHDWPFWLECVGGGQLWELRRSADAGLIALAKGLPCLWRQPRCRWDSICQSDQLNCLISVNRFCCNKWLPQSTISCPWKQKPQGTINSVCLGQEIPLSTLREYSAQQGTNDLRLMFVKLRFLRKFKSTKSLVLEQTVLFFIFLLFF